MGFILASVLAFGIVISVGAGAVILGMAVSRGLRRWQEWGLYSMICCLFSGSLFLIAKMAFTSPTSTGRLMAQGFQLAGIAFFAAGGSIGFGLMAMLAGLLMIVTWASRKP